VDKLELL